MSYIPPNNPKSGISITGVLLGVIVEQSYDKKYTNYRMGISTESRPDKFGQIIQTTNELELTEQQYQRLSNSIGINVNQPCRVWVDLDHRAGEKNGKVWDMLNLRMRPDSDIEYFNNITTILESRTSVNTAGQVLGLEPTVAPKIPDGIKTFK